jgi:hypothetical protein
MTSLATAVGGMKHWDWCPICRGGLDTGLECDQCGADFMPICKAFTGGAVPVLNPQGTGETGNDRPAAPISTFSVHMHCTACGGSGVLGGRLCHCRAPVEPTGCRDCDQLITERDSYHDTADQLANGIAAYLGIDIGEHSSGNFPWENAIEAIEAADFNKMSAPVEPGEICAWAYVDDGSWLTNCGESAILENGGTAYSDMRFCCFCGKPTP